MASRESMWMKSFPKTPKTAVQRMLEKKGEKLAQDFLIRGGWFWFFIFDFLGSEAGVIENAHAKRKKGKKAE